MRPMFTVIEYSSFFAVRHNASGTEAPMGDGVDSLFDGDQPLSPASEGFLEAWQEALNLDCDETMEAYFPDLDRLVEVDIPDEYLELCNGWAGDASCMLRAIDSTGGLTLGSIRPRDDDGMPMTDEAWHVSLFDSLSCDVAYNARLAEKSNHDDATALREFETWADATADMLRKSYGLDD